MTTRDEAVEQLKLIRTMMERATIFRALSGATALVGGAAALGAAWASDSRTGWAWAHCWLLGLAAVLVFNIFQIARASSSHGKPFWNRGLRLALRGAFPSLVAGGFLGLLFVRSNQFAHNAIGLKLAAALWILHYGVALLAIREFAPKSMVWLGWAFLIFGLYCMLELAGVNQLPGWLTPQLSASGMMAVAFGGFHLVYGALIVTTRNREPTPHD